MIKKITSTADVGWQGKGASLLYEWMLSSNENKFTHSMESKTSIQYKHYT